MQINNLSFGDVIENQRASESNPHRYAIFIKYSPSGDRIHCTNGAGEFWELVNDKESRTVKLGTYKSISMYFSIPEL